MVADLSATHDMDADLSARRLADCLLTAKDKQRYELWEVNMLWQRIKNVCANH